MTVEAAAEQESGESDDGTGGATDGGSSAAEAARTGVMTLALGALLRRGSADAG